MKPKVIFGADHGGFTLKNELITRLNEMCEIVDLGARAVQVSDSQSTRKKPYHNQQVSQ